VPFPSVLGAFSGWRVVSTPHGARGGPFPGGPLTAGHECSAGNVLTSARRVLHDWALCFAGKHDRRDEVSPELYAETCRPPEVLLPVATRPHS
jgi:hypothetical protein